MSRPALSPREPVGQQDEARDRYNCPADAEQQKPPAVDPVALRPVHDVQPPDEIEEPPRVASRGKDRTARCIDIDARVSHVIIGDLPCRKRAPEFGANAFVDQARRMDGCLRTDPGAPRN